mgnify:CR=1 FL=1
MMTNSSLQILDPLPRLAFVSTGGTIAGTVVEGADHWKYESAQRSGQSLLMGVPGLLRRAQWFFEQPYSIGSQNLELSHMLQLRALVLHLLHSPDVDGILLTHGTDTMEDMLYFLYLTLPASSLTKPVLFTGAMLPSDYPQADGPDNLNSSVDLLCHTLSSNKLNNHKAEIPFGLVMQGLYTPAAAVETTAPRRASRRCATSLASWLDAASTRPSRRGWMPTSVARYPSRPRMPRVNRACITTRSGIMSASATGPGRWERGARASWG